MLSYSSCLKKKKKKGRQEKQRQLGALICVTPEAAGSSSSSWGWQPGLQELSWGDLCSACGWEEAEGCSEEGSRRLVPVFLLSGVVVFPILVFPNPGIPSARAGLLIQGGEHQPGPGFRAALPQLGQIWEEIPEKCLLIQVWLCCTLRTRSLGGLSCFGPFSCKIPFTVVKYPQQSLIWR